MKSNNEYLRLGGVLLAITAVVALLLGFFNNMTADVIAAAKEEKKIASMQAVMPLASNFELSDEALPADGVISELYLGYDASGSFVGYCFTLIPKGYGGEMTVMAGIDSTCTITGVDIVSHSETAGLGANADDPEWLSQFAGKVQGLSVVKNSASGNQIQAVTSATITSNAVTVAVNQALDFAQTLTAKEAD